MCPEAINPFLPPVSSHGHKVASVKGEDMSAFDGVKPVKTDDAWFKFFKRLFPGVDDAMACKEAAVFRDNTIRMLEAEIKKNEKKAKEASQKLRKALSGEDG